MPRHSKASGTKVGGMRDLKGKAPYLQIVDDPRATTGKGATTPTIYGVIGRTKQDPYMASLQDIVMNTKASGRLPDELMSDKTLLKHHHNTERGCVTHSPATHIPGIHHGQVPYAGHFMSAT